ncbi:hypothetical protein K435DRAFT_876473 [Dendrothele bispora CBS 962.96]|uniref:Uncharacterized protein n=1 Tax=Dendrothele bispora (strain CBS 962.96) TaxID=1314807 RepID=A0A4S8KSA0_DENBC|nr:hypothetical protein K435DRAFT_876473 [Dendrothele bispora CBS 962.96]
MCSPDAQDEEDISGTPRCTVCPNATTTRPSCTVRGCTLPVDVALKLIVNRRCYGSHIPNLRLFAPDLVAYKDIDKVDTSDGKVPVFKFSTLQPDILELVNDYSHNHRMRDLNELSDGTLGEFRDVMNQYGNNIALREIEREENRRRRVKQKEESEESEES